MQNAGSTSIHLSWRDIRDLLLFVPVIHLGFCFVFLFFYSMAYGNSIEEFYSTADVLHVSFGDIAAGYLALIFVLPLGLLLGSQMRRERSELAQVGEQRAGLLFQLLRLQLVIGVTLYLVAGLAFANVYWALAHKIAVSSIVVVICSIFLLWITARYYWKQRHSAWIFVTTAAFPFFVAAFSGAQAAELDTVAQFQDLVRSSPQCGPYAIQRSIGDYYLAVKRDGMRVLIDDDCKERFTLPSVIRPH